MVERYTVQISSLFRELPLFSHSFGYLLVLPFGTKYVGLRAAGFKQSGQQTYDAL